VRFRWGQPEKIGGWISASTQTVLGAARKMKTWRGNDTVVYTAVGTSSKLYVFTNGSFFNITPIRRTVSLTNAWSTTSGSASVKVADTAHGAGVGDTVNFATTVTIGGLSLLGDYIITTFIDNDHYTITAGSNAGSTVNNGGGGPIVTTYEISIGGVDSSLQSGWGAGSWGGGTWGIGAPGAVMTPARTWSLDNWGSILVANPRGGSIYKWDPVADGLTVRATVIPNAPVQTTAIVIAPEQRFLIALGCNNNGTGFDPLVIAWCNQEDFTVWAPSITNSAGELRITGKGIIGGVRAKQEILVFTESEVHGLEYIAGDFIFGSTLIADNAGLIAPSAAIEFNGAVYWMGSHNFFIYDGNLRVMPSPVRTFVYEALNNSQKDKIHVGLTPSFREIWFFYPTATTENDRYVLYSPVEDAWSIGALSRTCWEGSEFSQSPFAFDPQGHIWQHESGTDDNGSAIDAYIESSDFDVSDGQQLMFVDRFIPDMDMSGQVSVTVKTLKYPNSPVITKGPYTITPSTQRIDLRARGRHVALRFESQNIGDAWTVSSIRFNAQPDGMQ